MQQAVTPNAKKGKIQAISLFHECMFKHGSVLHIETGTHIFGHFDPLLSHATDHAHVTHIKLISNLCISKLLSDQCHVKTMAVAETDF